MLLFFASWAALGALLGRSWRRLGDLLAPLGPLWALPKALLGSILASGGLLWELLGSIFTSLFENREILKNHCFFNVFSMFLRSRGVQNRAKIAPKSLLETSWRLLGPLKASWSALGASWRALGASRSGLGASWSRLGPNFTSKIKSATGVPTRPRDRFPPSNSPFRG